MKRVTITWIVAFVLLSWDTNAQKLYGVCNRGGEHNGGVVYRFNPDGSEYETLENFYRAEGNESAYCTPIQAANGKIYGSTRRGGYSNDGILFEYDPTNGDYRMIYSFKGENGEEPFGSLLEASNGKLYGTTLGGGVNNAGVLFEYDLTTNTFTKLYDFILSEGSAPYGELMQSGNDLFGMTRLGGANGSGTIYSFNLSTNTYTKRADFDNANGKNPRGGLIQVSSGLFYGLTYEGGVENLGVLFSFDSATNMISKQVDFDTASGFHPYSTLLEASNGLLYGVTFDGGADPLFTSLDYGTLFQYDLTTDSLTVLQVFEETFNTSSNRVGKPIGKLIQAANGDLYGMSYGGGVSGNNGSVYRYSISMDTVVKIYEPQYNGAYIAGYTPDGGLLEASDGKLYGINPKGGKHGAGDIIAVNVAADTADIVFNFGQRGPEGFQPNTKLCLASDGMVYGHTSRGGVNDRGMMFRVDTASGQLTTLTSLDFDTYYGFVAEYTPGHLLVLSDDGGANGFGALYDYDVSLDAFSELIAFDSINGSYVYSLPMKASNGKYYGIASFGGVADEGVIYEFDPAQPSITKRADFQEALTGSYPYGQLTEYNGKLYGTASSGGASGDGTIFSFDTTTYSIDVLSNFEYGTTGAYPDGKMTLASNDKMYVYTYSFAANNGGYMVEFDPLQDTITNVDMLQGDSIGAYAVYNEFVEMDSTYLYFPAGFSGPYGNGTQVRYNYINHEFEVLKPYQDPIEGIQPGNALLFVPEPQLPDDVKDAKELKVSIYPNPASLWLYITSDKKGGKVELIGANGNTVLQSQVSNHTIKLDVQHLASGAYLLKYMSPTGAVRSERVVIR